MAEKVKVRPDCIYASNPFHECTDYCSRKMAERKMMKDQTNSGSFGRKKKGSRPKPPIFAPSEVHSSTSRVSPKRNTESRNGAASVISSAKPYSEENGVKDLCSSDEQLESSQIFLPQETLITPANQQDSPTTKKDKEKREKTPLADAVAESHVVSAFGSSFSFSGIDHNTLEDEEDEEEVESVTSEVSVTVGKYRVKSSFSSILRSIFDKYGDIATTCKLESPAMRSYYLECVCYVVQELISIPFESLSKSKIKQLMAILKDIESSEMYVSWLSRTVVKTAEAFELSHQHKLIEEEKQNCDRDVESLQREVEAQMADLKMKEEEIFAAEERVENTKARLSQLQQKCSQMNEIILSIQSQNDIVIEPK